MHSSHYKSMTVHHNGDYSGNYIISNINRDEDGNNISGNDYCSILMTSSEFKMVAEKLIENNSFKGLVQLTGLDEDGREHTISIRVNSEDVVNFFLQRFRADIISKIEKMGFYDLVNAYQQNKVSTVNREECEHKKGWVTNTAGPSTCIECGKPWI